MKESKDLKGKRFGRWSVLERTNNDKHGHAMWICECDCGTKKHIHRASLITGKSTSCGCWQKEKIKQVNLKHGMSKTKEYEAYYAMRQRCYNPKNIDYYNYGERGIGVCERWRNSFSNFLEDMGKCPKGYTLDRLDNDLDYSPDNCRWADRKTQGVNRRTTRTVTHLGVETTYLELAEKHGITMPALNYRLSTGMSLEEALAKPVQLNKHTIPVICLNVDTGLYTIYSNYEELIDYFDNKESSVRRAISLKRIYLSKFLIKYSDDKTAWKAFKGGSKIKDDVIIGLPDSKMLIFDDILAALKHIDRNNIDIDSCSIRSLY